MSENTKRMYTWAFRLRTEMTHYAFFQPHQESLGWTYKKTSIHSQEVASTFPTSILCALPKPSVWTALETKGLGPDFKREKFPQHVISHTCHSHAAEKGGRFRVMKERENTPAQEYLCKTKSRPFA